MKSNLFMKRKLEIGLSLLIGTSVFGGCNNDLAPIRQSQTFPPNLNAPTVFESFSPDSGGVKTQLIIRGQNFGTDTAYLKVTVNNKRAAIVGVADDVIYAIVPARADTGYVRLFVGKDDNVEEYASQTKFIYQFKRNVTTLMVDKGKVGVMTDHMLNVNYNVLGLLWRIKMVPCFLLMRGVDKIKMVLCAVLRKAGWKLWCKIRVVHSKVLPVLRLIPSRTLFIFLICPTEVI